MCVSFSMAKRRTPAQTNVKLWTFQNRYIYIYIHIFVGWGGRFVGIYRGGLLEYMLGSDFSENQLYGSHLCTWGCN
jgi:hypothetical protein